MGRSPARKLVVKNSFLEIVETPFPHDTRNRSFTDGAIETMGRKDADMLTSDNTNSDYYSEAQLQQQHEAYPGLVGNGTVTSPSLEHHVRMSQDSAQLARDGGQLRPGLPLILENNMPRKQASTVQLMEALGGKAMHQQSFGQTCEQMMPSVAHVQFFQSPNQAHHLGRSQDFAAQYLGAVASEQTRHDSGNRPRRQIPSSGVVDAQQSNRHHLVRQSSDDFSDQYTTVMLRNLPNKYTRAMLLDMLNTEGFYSKFSFVYLPIDFKTHAGLGYAFVDLTSPSEAQRLRQHFEGFSRWVLTSDKVCTVSWSHPEQQGHAAHVERYRNSPVMHDSVPEDWKPALFVNGRHVPFPVPTRKIRPPRLFPLKATEN